jgi:hypothetical protein
LKLNATHHLSVYVCENILGGSILIYLGTTLTNQNCIHEDNKSRLKSGNACCHWVQNILSLECYPKMEILRYTVLFAGYLYCCETWSLQLRVECRLRMFENRVLRRIFGPKRDKVTGK